MLIIYSLLCLGGDWVVIVWVWSISFDGEQVEVKNEARYFIRFVFIIVQDFIKDDCHK